MIVTMIITISKRQHPLSVEILPIVNPLVIKSFRCQQTNKISLDRTSAHSDNDVNPQCFFWVTQKATPIVTRQPLNRQPEFCAACRAEIPADGRPLRRAQLGGGRGREIESPLEMERKLHAHTRPFAVVWIDAACADPSLKSVERLACVPAYMARCNRLLVLAGPTLADQLWCVGELFTWRVMCGKLRNVEVVLVASDAETRAAIIASLDAFHVMWARPPPGAEATRALVQLVEMAGVAKFNQVVRAYLPAVRAAVEAAAEAEQQAERSAAEYAHLAAAPREMRLSQLAPPDDSRAGDPEAPPASPVFNEGDAEGGCGAVGSEGALVAAAADGGKTGASYDLDSEGVAVFQKPRIFIVVSDD
eukprot:CAMPEP_0179931174 /NCGR_PEP_ID=MMETSP0983-20121128/10506_1 /TAXON_ID=483367 /ORGANISM="non described non described, Strain CCMP 2436" /LENGTH=361 /DNA_ID=CAMNT_0021835519 /DNA_START=224 /DNA_END=1310 /DNA_ORIENTATION=+